MRCRRLWFSPGGVALQFVQIKFWGSSAARIAASGFAFWLCIPALAQTPPPGWQAVSDPGVAQAVQVFAPAQPAPGESTHVTYHRREPLNGAPIERWLSAFMQRQAPPPGSTWSAAPAIAPQTANIASATRATKDATGTAGFTITMAVSVDQQQVRVAQWWANSEATGRRHAEGARALMTQITSIEKTSAVSERRGIDADPMPPRVDDIKPGGALLHGKYEGQVTSRGKLIRRIGVVLHANGEYELLGTNRVTPTGQYRYQPGTGKLDTDDILSNNRYSSDEDFCIFGRDANGVPVIYAEDHYGLGTFVAMLRRVGDADRLPPSQEQARKAAEEAEAKRYKFVTAPGQGLQPQDVEAIVYAWEQVYTIGGLQMTDDIYLLLKDGTVHDGLPVPPEDMDVALSKRREPQRWGRWKRQASSYAFAWPSNPGDFKPVRGGVLQGGRKGSTLQGHWQAASSYSIPGGASSWSKWGLFLHSDGRFEKYSQGGAGASTIGPQGTSVHSVWSDEGAVSSATGPNFAVGSERKNTQKGARSGRYEIDGHSMTLRYDNGKVERHPFAHDAQKQSLLWFEGAMLSSTK
jgi:hypothetical protein